MGKEETAIATRSSRRAPSCGKWDREGSVWIYVEGSVRKMTRERRGTFRKTRNEGDTVGVMLRAGAISGKARHGGIGRFLLLLFIETSGFEIAFISGPKSLPDHSERRVSTQGRGRKAGKDSEGLTGAMHLRSFFLHTSWQVPDMPHGPYGRSRELRGRLPVRCCA